MKIDLDLHNSPTELFTPRSYDKDLHDVTTMISDICEYLADHTDTQFKVSGFGLGEWLVDVRTDLAVFLEQLDYAIGSLRRNGNFDIDFYEQGLDRRISFLLDGDFVNITCIDIISWEKVGEGERMAKAEVLELFSSLRHSFVDLVQAISPEIASHQWFLHWSR